MNALDSCGARFGGLLLAVVGMLSAGCQRKLVLEMEPELGTTVTSCQAPSTCAGSGANANMAPVAVPRPGPARDSASRGTAGDGADATTPAMMSGHTDNLDAAATVMAADSGSAASPPTSKTRRCWHAPTWRA